MKYGILLTCTLCLLSYFSEKRTYNNKLPKLLTIKKKSLTTKETSLLNSLILGDKSRIKPNLKKTLKSYGLMHILTPSGLHLGSALFLIKMIPGIELIFLIILFIILQGFPQYTSMERVILFRLLYKSAKKLKITFNLEIIFLLTIFISILIGHLNKNPFSFIYSLAFWGTIILFRKNYVKMTIFLNITLHSLAAFTQQEISILSIFINPFITLIFTISFPFILLFAIFHSYISDLSFALSPILKIYSFLFELLEKISFIPTFFFEPVTIFLFLLLIIKNKSLAILILCLNIQPLNLNYKKDTNGKTFINLPHPSELLKQKNGFYLFIDQKCKMEDIKIFCKKRPSHLGGPNL